MAKELFSVLLAAIAAIYVTMSDSMLVCLPVGCLVGLKLVKAVQCTVYIVYIGDNEFYVPNAVY